MYPLIKKEISSFFSSITGYLVIAVFLTVNSLFLWVFPGELNVFDAGYSNLDTLFLMAPWVFLFLVPAITMKMFSEERKSGTLELLLTKPVSELHIVLAKFIAGVALVLLSLLPTLIYFFSVYQLGNPIGNIDTGGTWGSYIGLFFLGCSYVAMGIFASSLTGSQIVSFMIAVLISFFFFTGFDSISGLPFLSKFESLIPVLGINEHYRSISRGVVDSRDILYFLCLISLFILFTRTVLLSRKWKH
jgi:ABC-2 type transport system permease protein